MYFFIFLSMSISLTLMPYAQCTNSGISNNQSSVFNENNIRKASNRYLNSPYALISGSISDICEALALTNQTSIQRKSLRFFAVANKIIQAAAYGISAIDKPTSNNFKGSYLKQPIQALIAWNTARDIPASTTLLAHDTAIAEKLHRFSPSALKAVSRARIKNAIVRIFRAVALGYVLTKVTNNPDAWVIYNHLSSSLLYSYHIDHTATCPQLEASLLQEIAQDKKSESAPPRRLVPKRGVEPLSH